MNNKAYGGWNRMFRLLLPAFVLLLGASWAKAQTQVTGIVKDTTGEPLIGASVIEKGTSTGAATNFDGEFVLFIKDPKTAVLSVSYVGFEPQDVPLNGHTSIE
ncbi:MAG: carboxypeptidase-like regulatory domain-containing protein, partial [Muribaculaceae bacterium]|nr:carboxypeptidase-like regulatory domain-containing protein [Muribaculaceae bacterium]